MACTMPGFPDKFMPFMDADRWGNTAANFTKFTYGPALKYFRHRNIDNKYDKEPGWRTTGREARDRLPAAQLRQGHDDDADAKGAEMATTERPPQERQVVVKEMSWDPITRIVGSLGIHTEIDFTNQEVLKCYSTSMIFRGFDIFMKGIDPRDAHFITSRICGICGDNHCHLLVPEPEHGLRREAAEARRLRVQPGRVRRLHVRPRDLQRLHGERGLLRADGQGDEPVRAREGRADARRALVDPRLPDDRRHHAGAQPVHGRVLPRDAARRALHARDVLPLRRPPHAPLDDHAGRLQRAHHAPDDDGLLRPPDALLRVRQAHRADARRPLRLLLRGAARLREGRLPRHEPRLLGRLRRSRLRRLRLPDDDRVGPQAVRHARAS